MRNRILTPLTIALVLILGLVTAELVASDGPKPATGSGGHRVFLPIVQCNRCPTTQPTGASYVDWEDGYIRYRTIFIDAELTGGTASIRLTTRRGDEPDYRIENITADGPCTDTAHDLATFSLDVLNHCTIAANHPYPEWFVDFLIDARESGRPCRP